MGIREWSLRKYDGSDQSLRLEIQGLVQDWQRVFRRDEEKPSQKWNGCDVQAPGFVQGRGATISYFHEGPPRDVNI